MDLGVLFGVWDFEKLYKEMPPRIFTYWRARYLMEPWDMENQRSLAKAKYNPPKELMRKGRYMTKREILDAAKRAGI